MDNFHNTIDTGVGSGDSGSTDYRFDSSTTLGPPTFDSDQESKGTSANGEDSSQQAGPFSVSQLLAEVGPIPLAHYSHVATVTAGQQIQNSLATAASQGISPEEWTRYVVDQANQQAADNQARAQATQKQSQTQQPTPSGVGPDQSSPDAEGTNSDPRAIYAMEGGDGESGPGGMVDPQGGQTQGQSTSHDGDHVGQNIDIGDGQKPSPILPEGYGRREIMGPDGMVTNLDDNDANVPENPNGSSLPPKTIGAPTNPTLDALKRQQDLSQSQATAATNRYIDTVMNSPQIPKHIKAELTDPESLLTIIAGFLGGGFQSLSHAALAAYNGAQVRADQQNQQNQIDYENRRRDWSEHRDDLSDLADMAQQKAKDATEAYEEALNPGSASSGRRGKRGATSGDGEDGGDTSTPDVQSPAMTPAQQQAQRRLTISKAVTDSAGRTWLTPDDTVRLAQETQYMNDDEASKWSQAEVKMKRAQLMMQSNNPQVAAAGLSIWQEGIDEKKSILQPMHDYILLSHGQAPPAGTRDSDQWNTIGAQMDNLNAQNSAARNAFRARFPQSNPDIFEGKLVPDDPLDSGGSKSKGKGRASRSKSGDS